MNKNENLRLVRGGPVKVVEDVVQLNVKDLQEVVGGAEMEVGEVSCENLLMLN